MANFSMATSSWILPQSSYAMVKLLIHAKYNLKKIGIMYRAHLRKYILVFM